MTNNTNEAFGVFHVTTKNPMLLFSLRVERNDVDFRSFNWNTPTHTYECLVAVFQGNLVNFLRTRGRLLIPEQQLQRFALWVYLV